jgi:hypothetical protein
MGKGHMGPEHSQEGLKSEGSASAYRGSRILWTGVSGC